MFRHKAVLLLPGKHLVWGIETLAVPQSPVMDEQQHKQTPTETDGSDLYFKSHHVHSCESIIICGIARCIVPCCFECSTDSLCVRACLLACYNIP